MEDCYDVEGPFQTVIKVEPPLSGTVNINTLTYTADQFPHTQPYFGGTDAGLNLWAMADLSAGYKFDHWSAGNHTFADPDSAFAYLDLSAADTIVAHFSKVSTAVGEPVVAPVPEFEVAPTLFQDHLTINFTLPEKSKLQLHLFDLLGNQVAQLNAGEMAGKGGIQMDLNNSPLAPGVYFLRCTTENVEKTFKLVRRH